MKMITKATSDGIGYASKSDYEYDGKTYEADIKNGDKVTILDEGSIEPSQFGDQHYFKIKTRNGDKKTPFNQSSINVLVPAFGEESENWIGKEVTVLTKKTVIAGKKVIVAYFVTEGWYLDDFGDLVKDEAPTPRPAPQEPTEGQKQVEQARREGEELTDGDIPF